MSRHNQQNGYCADEGSLVIEPEPRPEIEPGTPMRKVVPPRLVGPYLTGQRDVLAGFVYRAADLVFGDPAEAFDALGLGFEGSEFTPGMSEFYAISWPARPVDGYERRDLAGDVPEYFIDPIPVPVGAAMHRIDAGTEELIALYDGIAWEQTGA
jgi:hypothetical protein